jgi:hypothetical protein
MTWGRQNGDAGNCAFWPPVCTYEGMDSLLNLRYRQMAIANNAIISPVGALWNYIRNTYPEINLYSADGSHPSLEGSYAAACSMIAVMLRTDPYLITYSSTLDPIVAEKIKLAAQAVVFNNLMEWHVGEYDPAVSISTSSAGLYLQIENQSATGWNFTWDFGDGSSSNDYSPQHLYNSAGSYVLSYNAFDACGRMAQGYFDITIQENNLNEIKREYRVRNLESGFELDFNFPVTSISVYDLSGRLIEYSQKKQNTFFVEKSISPKIIQFIMNDISHRILLGIE